MTDTELNESDIISYLEQHPEFFRAHPELLLSMEIPHHAGEGTISLLERQNELLRKQLDAGSQQLDQLITVARENDSLNNRMHQFTLTLLESSDFDALLDIMLDRSEGGLALKDLDEDEITRDAQLRATA